MASESTPASSDFWFDSDGTRLYAVAHGEGRPIILLHGGLATHLACLVFGAPLARRFRLVTPDLRASGRLIHRDDLTWAQLADDVAALVHHLGVTRAVIGGVSFGAGVAVATALRHPSCVDGLAILSPAYGGADLGLTTAQTAAMQAMDAVGRRAPAEGIEVLLPLFDALPPPVRERARRVVPTYDPASVAASTRFMASGVQPFASADDLAAITAPVLLCPGTDPTHPPEISDRFRRHLARCTVREVDATGYADAIADFVDGLPADHS